MAQPATTSTENTLRKLPGDVVTYVVSFLKLESLCALHTTGQKNGWPRRSLEAKNTSEHALRIEAAQTVHDL